MQPRYIDHAFWKRRAAMPAAMTTVSMAGHFILFEPLNDDVKRAMLRKALERRLMARRKREQRR